MVSIESCTSPMAPPMRLYHHSFLDCITIKIDIKNKNPTKRMIWPKPLPCLHRPLKALSLSPPSKSFPSVSISSASTTISMDPTTTSTTTIEHVVLFKVRPSTDPTKIESMITNLRSLTSLNLTSHLSAGPILRLRSPSASDLSFTHLLHSRYPSKSALNSYSAHPNHLSVVRSYPICDDIMAVDWVNAGQPPPPPPGSAMRMTLAKPREGVTAAEVVAAIEGAVGSEIVKRAEQLSFGENFSPARAKGYEVGFISVFKSVEELDSLMEDKDAVEAQKEKVRPLLDGVIVVDYVVPKANSASL